MNNNNDHIFSRSLEIFQSQIYSLNHLYNLHYSLMNSINTNITSLLQSYNTHNGVNTFSFNPPNNNTNTNNTNNNVNRSTPIFPLVGTTWNYGTNNYDNSTSFNRNTMPPPPPPSTLWTSTNSTSFNPPGFNRQPPNPRSNLQSPLSSRPPYPPPPPPPPPPSTNISDSSFRTPRRSYLDVARGPRERPVVWFGSGFDASNNRYFSDISNNTNWYDISGNFNNYRSRSFVRRNPAWRRRRNRARRPGSRFVPFFWEMTGPTNLSDLLNESLYDSQPRASLSNTLFNANTTTDTWDNIQNSGETTRNSICPITRERFSLNDDVTRINYCGHLFNREPLLEWFRYDTRCPICRYDLRRGTQTNNEEENNDISDNNTNTSNEEDLYSLNNPFNITSNLSSILDPSFSLLDLSDNIHNFSNQIANNIMSVLGDMDLSSNLIGAAAELTFNFPVNSTNNIFNNTNQYNEPYNNSTTENFEEEIVENIVGNILDNIDNMESNVSEEKNEDDEYMLEEKNNN